MIELVKDTKVSCQITDDEDVRLMIRAYKIFFDFEIFTRERLTPMKTKFEQFLKDQ